MPKERCVFDDGKLKRISSAIMGDQTWQIELFINVLNVMYGMIFLWEKKKERSIEKDREKLCLVKCLLQFDLRGSTPPRLLNPKD